MPPVHMHAGRAYYARQRGIQYIRHTPYERCYLIDKTKPPVQPIIQSKISIFSDCLASRSGSAMLPNFLIIGAPKAGTTWLYSRLRRHPNVFMPSVKELGFFNHEGEEPGKFSSLTTKDLQWYKYHFRNVRDESAVGEATPDYLWDSSAPGRIYELIPNARLIACLRHPTARAWSDYWMVRGMEDSIPGFNQFVEQRDNRFIELGRYRKHLDRYLSLFDRDQLLVLIHEEVFSHPSESLNQICSFLGVDDTFYQGQPWITETENPSTTIRSTFLHTFVGAVATWMRHTSGARQVLDALKATGVADLIKDANRKPREYPRMGHEVRERLDEYYASTVLRVEDILGREIKVWREKMVSGI